MAEWARLSGSVSVWIERRLQCAPQRPAEHTAARRQKRVSLRAPRDVSRDAGDAISLSVLSALSRRQRCKQGLSRAPGIGDVPAARGGRIVHRIAPPVRGGGAGGPASCVLGIPCPQSTPADLAMCGIAGLYGGGDIRAATARLAHRGPDQEGYHCDGPMQLGVRRLVVIDREGGRQPLSDARGDRWIVYNGELFNHIELRRELEGKGH